MRHSKSIIGTAYRRFLLIGSISYPGYVMSSTLKAKGYDVRVTEDISSLGFDSGTWKNWDRLREIGISPVIEDTTKTMHSHLDWLQKDEAGTVIYIPSLLFNAVHMDSFFDSKFVSSLLKTFTTLLESLKECNNMKVVVFTPKGDLRSSRHATAIRLFSLILSSYSHNYGTPASFIIMKAAEHSDAPHNLKYCNINELIDNILSSYLNNDNEFHLQCSTEQLKPLGDEAQDRKLHDVVTSTHLTRDGMVRKNSFNFMRGFFITAMHQKLEILLFHDELSIDVQKRLESLYEGITFMKINGLNGRSKNDARFYILYDYLLNHPEIRSIILQDIKDGIFPGNNPFNVMDVIGDVLYVGKDRSFFVSSYDYYWLKKIKFRECHMKELVKDGAQYHPFYNAGTVGGTRDVMLTFLTRLIKYFDNAPHQHNCNMATVSVAAHNHFFEHTFSGYPFQGYYETGIAIPRGLAVRHKSTHHA